MRVAIVPGTLALLPEYASTVDPIPELRAAVRAAVAWLLEDGDATVLAASPGARRVAEHLLGRSPDVAINHDEEAIALHQANHPTTRHYREDVWKVDPVKATGGRPVGLMWLSPDCKHFSKAKGGKPVSPRVRGLAWVAIRWANAVRPRVICLENVEEFQTWGPLVRATQKPCPARRGKHFRAFVRSLERLGYRVEWRQLRGCEVRVPVDAPG